LPCPPARPSIVRLQYLPDGVEQMHATSVGVAMLLHGQEVAVSRCGIDTGQRRQCAPGSSHRASPHECRTGLGVVDDTLLPRTPDDGPLVGRRFPSMSQDSLLTTPIASRKIALHAITALPAFCSEVASSEAEGLAARAESCHQPSPGGTRWDRTRRAHKRP
jgi:hypothetical protein